MASGLAVTAPPTSRASAPEAGARAASRGRPSGSTSTRVRDTVPGATDSGRSGTSSTSETS